MVEQKKNRTKGRANFGFTLIEVIAILIVLGVVAAVVGSRAASTVDYARSAEFEKIKGHLRYAQLWAMNTNADWGINITSSSTYELFKNTTANKVKLLGENGTTVSLGSLTISSVPVTVTFDDFGSAGPTDTVITTSGGTITVTANTGFVP